MARRIHWNPEVERGDRPLVVVTRRLRSGGAITRRLWLTTIPDAWPQPDQGDREHDRKQHGKRDPRGAVVDDDVHADNRGERRDGQRQHSDHGKPLGGNGHLGVGGAR